MIRAIQAYSRRLLPNIELSPPLVAVVAAVLGSLLFIGWAYFAYMSWSIYIDAPGLAHAYHDHAAHSHGGLWSPPIGNSMPWGVFDFSMLFVMWVMMTLAMMLPAVVPFVFLFTRIYHGKHTAERLALPVFVFVSGYLLAWSVYSVGATVIQWFMHTRDLITPAMESNSYLMSSVVLMSAGIYQWTPLKNACLKHCHTPMGYLLTHWRDGYGGAVRMGFGHGLFCVGCCWALMLVMLVVGMMNMLWLLVLTLFIFAEKTLIPRAGRHITGTVMFVWGGYYAWYALTVF